MEAAAQLPEPATAGGQNPDVAMTEGGQSGEDQPSANGDVEMPAAVAAATRHSEHSHHQLYVSKNSEEQQLQPAEAVRGSQIGPEAAADDSATPAVDATMTQHQWEADMLSDRPDDSAAHAGAMTQRPALPPKHEILMGIEAADAELAELTEHLKLLRDSQSQRAHESAQRARAHAIQLHESAQHDSSSHLSRDSGHPPAAIPMEVDKARIGTSDSDESEGQLPDPKLPQPAVNIQVCMNTFGSDMKRMPYMSMGLSAGVADKI